MSSSKSSIAIVPAALGSAHVLSTPCSLPLVKQDNDICPPRAAEVRHNQLLSLQDSLNSAVWMPPVPSDLDQTLKFCGIWVPVDVLIMPLFGVWCPLRSLTVPQLLCWNRGFVRESKCYGLCTIALCWTAPGLVKALVLFWACKILEQ